jgi:hypothetical protein
VGFSLSDPIAWELDKPASALINSDIVIVLRYNELHIYDLVPFLFFLYGGACCKTEVKKSLSSLG